MSQFLRVQSTLLALGILVTGGTAFADVEDATALASAGDYDGALEVLEREADEEAILLRAELLWTTGEYREAVRLARRQAEARRATNDAKALYGRFLYELGEFDGAVEILDAAVEGTDTPHGEARYWRALAFEALGRRSRAQLEMEDFIREYNRGQVDSVDELILVGLASHALENYHDADSAFREVLERDPQNQAVRLHWARLFMEKYRPDEAITLLREVHALNAHDPETLGLLAQAEFQISYDLDRVRAFVESALEVNPSAPEALEVLATLHMDDRTYEEGLGVLERVSENFPRRLSTLALEGAIHYLIGDIEAYEAVETEVLNINSRYGEFYYVVGEFASRNFRYADALALQERAIEVDGAFWPALASLGVSYSRVGDDGRALQFLQRAFDADPFNVQTFNMVELWESTLNDYRYVNDEEIEGLRYRFHRDERDLLSRFIPDVMRSTYNRYVDRYGEEPVMPLSIEVFREPETFGIRSVGVPYAMQHGICFGHVVTSRSPSDGNFNWRQVLEHELSHVFSLHASGNRVPRWFTEGIAEYDTILGNEGWRREHDTAIIRALQRDELLSVLELNRAFVSTERPDGILEAYFQASLTVEYIGEEYGYPALVEMLHGWRDGQQTPDVIASVLEQTVQEFDVEFSEALREHYGPQMEIFEPVPHWFSDYATLAETATESPDVARAQAELAWAEFQRGDTGAAAAALDAAMALDSREPYALFLAGQLAFLSGANSSAATLFDELVEAGFESPTAYSVMAAVERAGGDLSAAAEHLAAAAALSPTDVTIVREQASVAAELGDALGEIAFAERAARLDQHDVESCLRVAEYALGVEDLERASFFANRAIDIAPFRADVQTLSGRVAARTNRWSVARRDLELAIAAGPDDREALLRALLQTYEALGLGEDAERVRRGLIE